jgi:hypothetical protein
MVKAGDKVANRKIAGEFWADASHFTGFYAVKASGGYQLIRFTTWTGNDGTVYPTDTVCDASAVLPSSSFRRYRVHETASRIYYGFTPAN